VEFAREAFSTGSLRAALCSLLRPYGFLARKLLVTYSSAKLFLLKLKTRVSGDKSAIITYSKTKYTSAKEKKKSPGGLGGKSHKLSGTAGKRTDSDSQFCNRRKS
jgi:hypothetical protein